MKNTVLFLTLLLGLSLLSAGERFELRATSPRRIQLDKKQVIQLTPGNFEIVVPASASPTARYAGNELAGTLGTMLGTKITPLRKGTGKTALIVGDKALASAWGLDLKALDRDGYYIKSRGNQILLIGRDDSNGNPARHNHRFERATLFAVQEFLERFAGVRYYFPGEMGTVIPKKKELLLPGIDLADRPDMQTRSWYIRPWKPVMEDQQWLYTGAPKNFDRLLSHYMRSETRHIPNCHGLGYLELVDRFAKSHPEYFALNANGTRWNAETKIGNNNYDLGHLCWSNKELKEILLKDAEALLTGKPASSRGIRRWSFAHTPPFFNLMPNDGMPPCHCPECWPHFKQNPQHVSNFMWEYFSSFAQELKKRNVPGFVTTMAYGACKPVPECDLPDNMIVMVAVTGPYNELLKMQKADDQRIIDWHKKLGTKPYLWLYPTKARAPIGWVPNASPHAMETFFKRLSPHIFGAFLESETDVWIFGYLNYYISSKLLWDISLDVDKVLDEHYLLMFGSAAPEMKKIYNRWEELWMKNICGECVDTPIGPKGLIPSQNEVWTRIYSPAGLKSINALFDAAEKKCAGEPEALKRVRFIRSELWGNVLKGAEKYRRSSIICDETVMPELPENARINIDGALDEKAWQNAPAVWLRIRKGDTTPVATKVKALRDKEYFYFGFECEEPETDKMIASSSRKFDDPMLWEDNCVELFLDTAAGRKEYYQIQLSSANKVSDNHKKPGFLDWKWNSGVKTAVKVVPGKCWYAELAVPRKSMTAANGKIHADFSRLRTLKGKTEYYNWIKLPPRAIAEQFGVVHFSAPENKNLIQDPDFQQPITYGNRIIGKVWAAHTIINRDTKVFRFGGSSVRMEDKCHTLQQTFSGLKPSTKYKLSYFIKLEKLSRPGLYVRVFEGNGRVHHLPPINPKGTAGWHKLEFTFNSGENPPKNGKSTLFFVIGKSTGKVWIDRVAVEEVRK